MNFDLSDEQQALQASVRKFAQNELPEVAKKVEETNQSPGIELRKRYSELGYLGTVSYTHLTLPTTPYV